MLIGIDGNEANVEKRVGISEYAFELLMQFSNAKFKNQSAKFVVYLKSEPRLDMPTPSEYFRYKIVKPARLWTQIGLPFDLFANRPKPHVFFSPTHYAPRFSPVPTVVSIMDLSYIHYPEMFRKSDLYQLRNWTAYSVKKAKKILTISESSRNDILKEYTVSENNIVVTYPGIKQQTANRKNPDMANTLKKYGIHGQYILFVGTIQPRKNIVRLIEAFAKVQKSKGAKEQNLSLVIVGKPGWLYEEILRAPKKFDVETQVKFLYFVSDEDLEALYLHALCFVLPSLYEGFGLPVLEAMSYGIPVITSNISSLPEAGGSACLYVDPYDTEDIAKKISMLAKDEGLRKDLITKGKRQVKKFSWEKTAKQTLTVLEDAALANT